MFHSLLGNRPWEIIAKSHRGTIYPLICVVGWLQFCVLTRHQEEQEEGKEEEEEVEEEEEKEEEEEAGGAG